MQKQKIFPVATKTVRSFKILVKIKLEENLYRVYTKNMQNKHTVHHTKPFKSFRACAEYHLVLVKSETK